MCCHGFVFLKKEVPICQLLVPGGALSTQASQAADPSAQTKDRY